MRRLSPEETRLWRKLARSVRAFEGRVLPEAPPEPAVSAPASKASAKPAGVQAVAPIRKPSAALHAIEPGRERRIALGREEIGGRIDLHGHGQDDARAVLTAFLKRAHADGIRAVLVITGQGRTGAGVLRRRLPDWLNEPPLRELVAGLSPARRRHGGEGAFYVALKRRG